MPAARPPLITVRSPSTDCYGSKFTATATASTHDHGSVIHFLRQRCRSVTVNNVHPAVLRRHGAVQAVQPADERFQPPPPPLNRVSDNGAMSIRQNADGGASIACTIAERMTVAWVT